MSTILFWIIYTVAAIWMQFFLPGPDFFVPALLLCLQQNNLRVLAWLLLPWILIQEGAGTLSFGTALLWYSGLIVFFNLVRHFFQTTALPFILLFFSFAGCWYYLSIKLMATLQDLHISKDMLLISSLKTALILPLVWILLLAVYKRIFYSETYV